MDFLFFFYMTCAYYVMLSLIRIFGLVHSTNTSRRYEARIARDNKICQVLSSCFCFQDKLICVGVMVELLHAGRRVSQDVETMASTQRKVVYTRKIVVDVKLE